MTADKHSTAGRGEIKAPSTGFVAIRINQYRSALAFALLWTFVVAATFTVRLIDEKKLTVEYARILARGAYEKDLVYRRWVAIHGGVYVPITEYAQPNPHLAHLENRDVTTISGVHLTLINPAYMTRQVHELGREQYGALGHITSLDPIRPENASDPWETAALEEFNRGVSEVSSLEPVDGSEYFRFMRPLITEESCLSCHAAQGYRVGDVRGGISISVPMQELRAIERKRIVVLSLSIGLAWILGLVSVYAALRKSLAVVRKRETEDEERVELETELLQSQKLASIGTLAGGVAHEINNPINGIMNYAELIKTESDPGSRTREFASEIVIETERVASIVKRLLDFAEQNRTARRPARMADIVNDATSHMATAIRHDHISLDVDVPSDLPNVKCNSPQIQQLITNLLVNARDALNERYTDGDGNKLIRISAQAVEKDLRSWVRTTVEDRGRGIPPEVRDHLFEPFFTTKDRAVASGLGLASAFAIAKNHSGVLTVESEPESYTRFHLDLPVDNGWETKT